MLLNRTIIVAVMALVMSTSVLAKDWQVQMLSFGKKGPMVFEPSFVQAQVGDTVTFVPTNPGHHVKSYLTPEGQTAWESKLNETYTVTLTEEGLQLYYCPPHLVMGMVGIIQVGDPVNKADLDAAYPEFRDKIAINPERVDAILSQIQ